MWHFQTYIAKKQMCLLHPLSLFVVAFEGTCDVGRVTS